MPELTLHSILAACLMAGITACSVTDTVAMKDETDSPDLIAGIEPVESADSASSSTSLIFYVANQGDADIEMLMWNTPFEKTLSADVFTVKLNGESVTYNGRKVKRGTPQPDSFIKVPAGERVEIRLDMATYYAMEQAGEYSVTFEPVVINGVSHLNEQSPVRLASETLRLEIVEY